jgi:hypothetical protein
VARKLTPAMEFYRDVQKLAPDMPFLERAKLARLAKRMREQGVTDPRRVVEAFQATGGRTKPNPDRSLELLLAGGLGALLVYVLLKQQAQVPQQAEQPSQPSIPTGGCGCS